MKTLLRSRKFWAAVTGLVVIVISAFLPGFPQLEQPLTEVALLFGAYIMGTAAEGIQPAAPEDTLRALLRSRKFWAAVAGLLVILLEGLLPGFPLSEEQLTAAIITISAYIFGTGTQDGISRLRSAGSNA